MRILFDYMVLWGLQVCIRDLEIVLIMSSDSHQTVIQCMCLYGLERVLFDAQFSLPYLFSSFSSQCQW